MLTPEALTVLRARYLQNGESPEEMFWRVAKHVASAEAAYGQDSEQAAKKFFSLMSERFFLPNSPALMNAGKPRAQMAACFVLPIEDSLEGIFDTLKYAALIHQSGGGTGFAFSRLRPKGDSVALTGGVSSGPVSFMHIFNAATEVVRQGAVRRGANMAVLRVDHPDICEFITAKRQPNLLNNFNLSVAVTDEFMKAAVNGESYNLVNPRNGMISAVVSAKDIFDRIVHTAWENGEPGLFFIDTVNRANPTPALGAFESPNPCSEQPLLPYESCVLGSINMTRMIIGEGDYRQLDVDKLNDTVDTAIRFLDNVIDVNSYPLEQVAAATAGTRKIGLGIMGLADLFILLDVPYASEAGLRLTETIMRLITSQARQTSAKLAAERGCFPAYNTSVYARQGQLMRNATVTTIAPTGTLSILAGCSGGIEPNFALSVSRRALDGKVLQSVNKYVLAYLEERNLLTPAIREAIMSTGSVQNTALPDRVKEVLVTAHDIPPQWHVKQLAAAQRYTDNGVSKTVNLPHCAAPADVADVFLQAWRTECKGVTVYRDGSRQMQVLNSGVNNCPVCS